MSPLAGAAAVVVATFAGLFVGMVGGALVNAMLLTAGAGRIPFLAFGTALGCACAAAYAAFAWTARRRK